MALSNPTHTPTQTGAQTGCTNSNTTGAVYTAGRTAVQGGRFKSVADGDSQAEEDADKALILAQGAGFTWEDEQASTASPAYTVPETTLVADTEYFVGWAALSGIAEDFRETASLGVCTGSTRASLATVPDYLGVVHTIAVDQMAFSGADYSVVTDPVPDPVDGLCEGFVREVAGTTLISSADSWSGATAGPDSNGPDLAAYNSLTIVDADSIAEKVVTYAVSGTCSYSIYLKSTSSRDVRLTVNGTTEGTVSVTSAWTRFEVQYTGASGDYIGVKNDVAGGTEPVYFSMEQVESGPVASSYIYPTFASRTRAIVSGFTPLNLSVLPNGTQGSWCLHLLMDVKETANLKYYLRMLYLGREIISVKQRSNLDQLRFTKEANKGGDNNYDVSPGRGNIGGKVLDLRIKYESGVSTKIWIKLNGLENTGNYPIVISYNPWNANFADNLSELWLAAGVLRTITKTFRFHDEFVDDSVVEAWD